MQENVAAPENVTHDFLKPEEVDPKYWDIIRENNLAQYEDSLADAIESEYKGYKQPEETLLEAGPEVKALEDGVNRSDYDDFSEPEVRDDAEVQAAIESLPDAQEHPSTVLAVAKESLEHHQEAQTEPELPVMNETGELRIQDDIELDDEIDEIEHDEQVSSRAAVDRNALSLGEVQAKSPNYIKPVDFGEFNAHKPIAVIVNGEPQDNWYISNPRFNPNTFSVDSYDLLNADGRVMLASSAELRAWRDGDTAEKTDAEQPEAVQEADDETAETPEKTAESRLASVKEFWKRNRESAKDIFRSAKWAAGGLWNRVQDGWVGAQARVVTSVTKHQESEDIRLNSLMTTEEVQKYKDRRRMTYMMGAAALLTANALLRNIGGGVDHQALGMGGLNLSDHLNQGGGLHHEAIATAVPTNTESLGYQSHITTGSQTGGIHVSSHTIEQPSSIQAAPPTSEAPQGNATLHHEAASHIDSLVQSHDIAIHHNDGGDDLIERFNKEMGTHLRDEDWPKFAEKLKDTYRMQGENGQPAFGLDYNNGVLGNSDKRTVLEWAQQNGRM